MNTNINYSQKNHKKSTSHLPMFSVIIPIYNAEKFLDNCIESILAQTFSDFEVLLIDDGSKDSSPLICQFFSKKDSRIRYYKKDNGGPLQARIFGIGKAYGKYITFCDADDFYTKKDAFAILYDNICKTNCSAIQFGYVRKFNHLKQRKNTVSNPLLIKDRETFLFSEYPKLLCSFWDESHLTPSIWNKIYRKELLQTISGFKTDEKIFFGEDLILNLHFLQNCDSFLFIADILYTYRENVGGNTKFSTRTMFDLNKIKEYQLKFLKMYEHPRKETILNVLYHEMTSWFFAFICQAQKHIQSKDLKQLIKETLTLSSFVQGQQYYLEHPEENWLQANLLRKGNSDEYLTAAKNFKKINKPQELIEDFLRKIYYNI